MRLEIHQCRRERNARHDVLRMRRRLVLEQIVRRHLLRCEERRRPPLSLRIHDISSSARQHIAEERTRLRCDPDVCVACGEEQRGEEMGRHSRRHPHCRRQWRLRGVKRPSAHVRLWRHRVGALGGEPRGHDDQWSELRRLPLLVARVRRPLLGGVALGLLGRWGGQPQGLALFPEGGAIDAVHPWLGRRGHCTPKACRPPVGRLRQRLDRLLELPRSDHLPLAVLQREGIIGEITLHAARVSADLILLSHRHRPRRLRRVGRNA